MERHKRLFGKIIGVTCLILMALALPVNAEPVAREKVLAALPKLEDLVNSIIAKSGVPGLSVAIVHNDEVVYLKGFGLREMGKPEPVDADTVFQLASLSKPISSTVVAALVSDGVVDWDSRIAGLNPAFQLHDPYPSSQVTVRDLFSHRSGLPGDAGNELESIGFNRDEVLHKLRLVPPSSSFRAGYSYSNAGLTAGAISAAMPTAKAWETVAEEKLYQPLGMTSTSSRYADFVAHANRSSLHIKVNGAWVAKVKRDADMQAPAGGVSSNVRDLAQWMRLELASGKFGGKQLISEAAIGQTHVPLVSRGGNPITGSTAFYGLGWNVEFGRHGMSWGHAGAFSVGARTLVTLYPNSGLGIVVLTNAFPTGVPEGIADSFGDLVFDGKIGKDWVTSWNEGYESLFGPAIAAAMATYGKPPAGHTAALGPEAYIGGYANDYVGTAKIADEGGVLTLKLGPGGAHSYALSPFDRDIFLYYPDPETADVPSAVRFSVGPDGKASSVTIEPMNGSGLGTLTRAGG